MSVIIAARTLGEASAWRLSNVEMQKVLYVAQMLHLGRAGTPLFQESFEAWDFGPVVPRLYQHNKSYKRQAIPEFRYCEVFEQHSSQWQAVSDAYTFTRHLTPGQLIAYTHRIGGAWEKHYRQGELGGVIPNSDILSEFQVHMQPSDEAVAWAERMADEVAANPSPYLDRAHERAFRERVLAARLH